MMPSGPDALCGFRFSNIFSTPFGVKSTSGISSKCESSDNMSGGTGVS